MSMSTSLLLSEKKLSRIEEQGPQVHGTPQTVKSLLGWRQCCALKALHQKHNAALQGKYDGMTFWEQLDDGVQNTSNRKFLTLVPVVLFLLATHGTDYRWSPSLLMALLSCSHQLQPAPLQSMNIGKKANTAATPGRDVVRRCTYRLLKPCHKRQALHNCGQS